VTERPTQMRKRDIRYTRNQQMIDQGRYQLMDQDIDGQGRCQWKDQEIRETIRRKTL